MSNYFRNILILIFLVLLEYSHAYAVINSSPEAATFTAELTGGTTICAGSQVTLMVTFNGGKSPYTFTYNNGINDFTVTGVTSPYPLKLFPSTTRSYSLKSASDSKGSVATIIGNLQTVTVNNKSANPTFATASSSTVCSGSATTLSLIGGGGGNNELIKWYGGACGGTLVGTGNNLTVFPTVTTTYYGRYEDGAPCNYQSTCASVKVNVTAKLTPSVSITALPGNIICSGTFVTLIATSLNTGSGSVNYNFMIDGQTVQNGSSNVYFTSSLADNNSITCNITISNGVCLKTTTASSNAIVMSVSSSFTPTVSLTAKPGFSICAGTNVKFTAKAKSTGGGLVNYNFRVNNKSVQNSTSNTFSTNGLADRDVVDCEITVTDASCLTSSTASSERIPMSVSSSFTPSVTLSASPGFSVCEGDNVTFIAAASNTGTDSVIYNFIVNNKSVQYGQSNTYSTNTLVDNDAISCEITVRNVPCLTDSMASSDTFNMSVNERLTPKVAITSSTGDTICSGTKVTFIATANSIGTADVTYNFLVNNVSKQNNSSNIYSTKNLSNGDAVNCVITANGGICLNSTTASSNIISMTVFQNLTPQVSISVSPKDTICETTAVTFTAIAGDAGGGQVNYDFRVNNTTRQNDTIPAFKPTTLKNGDVVTCIITVIDGTCLTSDTASSNRIVMTVAPAPTVNTILDTTYCNGDLGSEIVFTSFPTSNLFSWKSSQNIGFGISGSGNIPQFIANSGTNAVTVIDTVMVSATANGCTGNSMVFHINVNPSPSVQSIPDMTYCNGVKTNAITFSSITPGSTYIWYNKDPTIGLPASGVGSIPSFVATDSGAGPRTSLVSVYAIANGCIGPDSSFNITVNPSPSRPFFHSLEPNNTAIQLCKGSDNINFNIDFPGGLSYQWLANPSNGVEIKSEFNPNTVVSFAAAGNYTIKAIAYNSTSLGGCPDSAEQLVSVSDINSILERKIFLKQPGNLLVYPDNSLAPDSGYQWGYDLKFNDSTLGPPVEIPGQVYQVFIPSAEFINSSSSQLDTVNYCFWVLLKEGGCLTKVYYNGPYSVNRLEQESAADDSIKVSVYPNPSRGAFNILVSGKIYGNIDIRIYNTLSQTVFQSEFPKKSGETTQMMDDMNLQNGIYWLELTSSDHQKLTAKVMICK